MSNVTLVRFPSPGLVTSTDTTLTNTRDTTGDVLTTILFVVEEVSRTVVTSYHGGVVVTFVFFNNVTTTSL